VNIVNEEIIVEFFWFAFWWLLSIFHMTNTIVGPLVVYNEDSNCPSFF
jgi:hypothetical protein